MPEVSTTQWAVLALAAVAVFWMVGAYNRLVALRNAIGGACGQIDLAVKHRGAALVPLVAALREPLAGEQGALDAFVAAHDQTALALAALCSQPVARASAASWVRAETALAAASSRVMALLEQQPALVAAPAVAALVATWREGESQLAFARRVFDAAAQAYNDAAQQPPTSWLLRLFGFGPAGLLG